MADVTQWVKPPAATFLSLIGAPVPIVTNLPLFWLLLNASGKVTEDAPGVREPAPTREP